MPAMAAAKEKILVVATKDPTAARRYETFHIEIAKRYLRDYEKLDAGEPYACFNFVRLSNLYAAACICYYKHDSSPIQDDTFDGLCRYLLEFYDDAMASGVWGGVLDKEMLKAGSGYHYESFRLILHNIAQCIDIALKKRVTKRSTG